ncbi:consortin, connexin sorting protein b [Osmerus mordax]|uniref:consortin, connexin sorting protein b n=1 Tax=Osmerus mordax TaxID=8014 RepID=UPI00350F2B45
MGNKSSVPNRGTESGPAQGGHGGSAEFIPAGPRGGPSPELLASLQTLGENSDYALLPQSLHQIAEAYSLEEDYPWAVQFLQLERLYHERLLSNLAALQESWESQCRESTKSLCRLSLQPNSIGQEHIDVLSKICRTHQRPTLGAQVQSMADAILNDIPNTRGQCGRREDEEEVREGAAEITSHEPDQEREEGEEGGGEEEEGEEGEEECEEPGEESPEEEVLLEWPAGVPQASVKDLAKLSYEEGSSPDGLVSILKRRRASLDGLPPPDPDVIKQISKRKVRFSEPEDGIDHDEVGGDSCLILLLLCLVTVVMSLGGTAVYCALVDSCSSICTDFSHNANFYVTHVRRFLDELRRWLPLKS